MENKVILENERTYTCDDIKVAGKELLNSRVLALNIILTIIFVALGGGFIGLSFVFNNDITILGSGILIIVMTLIMWGFYIFAFIKIDKKEYKDTEYKYTFYEDEVVVSTNSKNLNQHMVLKYNQFIKGVKCKNYTFLFINKAQSLFFLNSDLNENVYNLLKNNLNKFKD